MVIPNEKTDSNAFAKINELRLRNPKNVLIGHLNVDYLQKRNYQKLLLIFYFHLKRKSMKHFQAVNLKLAAIKCFIKFSRGIMIYVNKTNPVEY